MIVDTKDLTTFYHTKPALEEIVKSLCSNLIIPQGEDKFAFLWAMCGMETSYGIKNRMRYEGAYAPGGRYYFNSEKQRELYKTWGVPACCSHGVTQIMYITAIEFGYNGPPYDLIDARVSLPITIKILNEALKAGAFSIEDKAARWNGGIGSIKRRSPEVQKYVDNFKLLYLQYKGTMLP